MIDCQMQSERKFLEETALREALCTSCMVLHLVLQGTDTCKVPGYSVILPDAPKNTAERNGVITENRCFVPASFTHTTTRHCDSVYTTFV